MNNIFGVQAMHSILKHDKVLSNLKMALVSPEHILLNPLWVF